MNGYCDKKDDTCSTTATWINSNFLKDERLLYENTDKIAFNDELTHNIINIIIQELMKKRAVIISMRPDHHFVVYKNKNYVEIYQSSAHIFYLKDWMDYYYDRNTPKLSLELLSQYLFEYLAKDFTNLDEAIKKLFTLGPTFPQIEHDSLDYYADLYKRYITKVHSYNIKYGKKKNIHSIDSDHIDELDIKFVS